jgi:glycosyltransferase involved in cell wall biosynthesis
VLIVVPALNEEQCLPGTLAELHRRLPGAEVVVVDDGSTDATAEVARAAGVPVLRLPFNLGVGGAMRAGFLHAHRNGFAAVVQLDADGQHDPAQVPTCCAAWTSRVWTSWSAPASTARGTTRRGAARWAMYLLARVVSRRTGVRLTDVTSGFRVAGPRAVSLFAQRYPADYLGDTVESLLLAHSAGLLLCQQPVRMRSRSGGLPSTPPLRSTLYLLRALLVLVVFLARGRRSGRSVARS